MKKDRIVALVLSLAMFSAFLVSCGDGGSAEATDTLETTDNANDQTSGMNGETPFDFGISGDLPFGTFDEAVEVHIGRSVNPVDSTLPEGDSADDNQYTRYLLENYNIKIVVDWTAASGTDYDQKVSLAIATASLPDGLVTTQPPYMRKAAQSDLLYDLTEIYNNFASDQVKGIVESTEGRALLDVEFDGKMLALPNITADSDGVNVLHIRKDWLDEYDLDIPETLSDIQHVASVFKEEQPAGSQTIAISAPDKNGKVYGTFLESSNNTFSFDPVFAALDAYPGFWILDEDGQVQYGTILPETRAALELLSEWYQEGLIDPEIGTRERSMEPVNANQSGMFFGPWWALGYGNGDSFRNDPTANWQSYAVYTDDGEWNIRQKTTGREYTLVNKNVDDKVAAAIMIMYNALVRDEAVFDTSVAIEWYPLRNVAAAANETEYEHVELLKVLRGETSPEDYSDPDTMYKLMYSDAQIVKDTVPGFEDGRDLNVTDFSLENLGDFNRMYAILIGDRPFTTAEADKAVSSVTYALTETMEQRWSNLEKMENEMVLKIITGQSDISEFDDFVERWKAQGGDTIIGEVQALADE